MVRQRMTGKQRREQLISIGRSAFAEQGFDGTSVEDIAARASVSKPVVYEHFGGKEGLYAVVVDREMQDLERRITASISEGSWRDRIEQAAMALLTYVEEETDGFMIWCAILAPSRTAHFQRCSTLPSVRSPTSWVLRLSTVDLMRTSPCFMLRRSLEWSP